MTSESAQEPVHQEQPSPGVTVLRIDRPQRRNALDQRTVELLRSGLADAAARQDAAVVLTGGDEFFSSGGDVASMPGPEGGVLAPARRLTMIHDLVTTMVRADQVILAAVERYAIGAAWGIVLACDLVVAGENAYFKAPFASRGLTADAGTAYHLPRRLGQQRAAAHLFLGEPLTVSDARTAGLVTETVPPGSSTARAIALAETLAAGPNQSNALTKSLLAQDRSDLAQFLANERAAMALANHGPNAREGRAAFLERREPRFS
ncbi:enoyl-CoA hydratase/isomerase family protein [Nocardia callitridis]|uniref:Enoyl-CoA hydratase-related protein n=1 Tax=Nocardia callitridis TaxID=648753 RepID=A0ABP9KDI3_9NOCA